MDRKKLFKRLAVIIFLIFILNFTAHLFYWYYTIWYFDIVMHFLGGFFIALLVFWIFPTQKFSGNYLFKIILGLFVIGVGWEVFEIIFKNIIAGEIFNPLDTVSDIFCDLAGGSLAAIYFLKRIVIKGENDLSKVSYDNNTRIINK